MSTRACYLFSDDAQPGVSPKDLEGHVVFKHHDGYPSGAVEFLDAALKFAWPLPRFEADEFAAAFVSANKTDPGGVRLCGLGKWTDLASSDIEYIYFVKPNAKGVIIATGYSAGCDWAGKSWTVKPLFEQPLAAVANATITEDDE